VANPAIQVHISLTLRMSHEFTKYVHAPTEQREFKIEFAEPAIKVQVSQEMHVSYELHMSCKLHMTHELTDHIHVPKIQRGFETDIAEPAIQIQVSHEMNTSHELYTHRHTEKPTRFGNRSCRASDRDTRESRNTHESRTHKLYTHSEKAARL